MPLFADDGGAMDAENPEAADQGCHAAWLSSIPHLEAAHR